MAKLIYSAICSLDGYVADERGDIDWSAPDEEVHAFLNDRERDAGTYLYGRRMYEVMVAWEAVPTTPDQPPAARDFARIWRAADKIVYSRTLQQAGSARTRIEREFDPDAVRRMKETAERDLTVGGPELAGHALRAGLVDECRLYLVPMIIGGGRSALPAHVRLGLDLREERRFGSGVVYLRYAVVTPVTGPGTAAGASSGTG